MHASDDRYAEFFLFTEEVEMQCRHHGQVWPQFECQPFINLVSSLTLPRFEAATRAIRPEAVSDLSSYLTPSLSSRPWRRTRFLTFGSKPVQYSEWSPDSNSKHLGRYTPLSQKLWRASEESRGQLDLLVTQQSAELVIDDDINFLTSSLLHVCHRLFDSWSTTRYDSISDAGLWSLLYYTGYLTARVPGIAWILAGFQ